MLKTTSHITNETRKLQRLKDDLLLTLQANPGLRFHEEQPGRLVLEGSFYVAGEKGELLDYFNILIKVGPFYPYCFPELYETAGKIERIPDNHIDGNGLACVELTYIAEHIAKRGIRIFDFVNYYVRKYFAWHVIRKHDPSIKLEEWEHSDDAKSEFYRILLKVDTIENAIPFIEQYISAEKVKRNDPCYCGSRKKLKDCHYQTALFLKEMSRNKIKNDLIFLKRKHLTA